MVTTLKWSEMKSLSRVRLFATPWTVAYQAPQSMEFSRQEYWSGLLFPSLDLHGPDFLVKNTKILNLIFTLTRIIRNLKETSKKENHIEKNKSILISVSPQVILNIWNHKWTEYAYMLWILQIQKYTHVF